MELAAELASFDALCSVLDVFTFVKNNVTRARECAGKLRRALMEHNRLHVAVYGTALIRPKHHWTCDIPDQWEKVCRFLGGV